MKAKVVSKKYYPELNEIEKRLDVVEISLPWEPEDLRKLHEYVKDGQPDIVIAVGGDATFLRKVEEDVPILPIRGGEKDSLGWHADFGLDKIGQALDDIENGLYDVEELRDLKVEFKGESYNAINDVYVNRIGPILHCRVYCISNEETELLYPRDLKGDGFLIASSYGSTAYNRTAGGPILYNVQALVGTPLYSMSFMEPIVTKDGFVVEVIKNKGLLQYDGITIGEIFSNENFRVEHSDRRIEVIKPKSLKESLASKLERLYRF